MKNYALFDNEIYKFKQTSHKWLLQLDFTSGSFRFHKFLLFISNLNDSERDTKLAGSAVSDILKGTLTLL